MKQSTIGMVPGTIRKGMRKIGFALILAVTLVGAGCGGFASGQTEPITVYLWSSELYNGYAQYIQSQLPDVDIQFVMGNNDLDFYGFLAENGALPDIITSRRFSLNDAARWKDCLMDLSTTEEAGAIYETYLSSFTDSDGKISWLPVCGMVDGIVANRALFTQHGIELPTDYESFVAACQAFEAAGIRGYAADYVYDYMCLELLQGWSIPELNSLEGQSWRLSYEDPQDEMTGLDQQIWPEVFRRMEQFLRDTKARPEDTQTDYGPFQELFMTGQTAMIRNTGASVVNYNSAGMDTVLLPYFGTDGESWLMTYPSFHVALSGELQQDKQRQAQALRVLKVMLSEGGQNALATGDDVISYSQTVNLMLDPALENLGPCIQQNHLYIRLASNSFFSVSKDVVTKMIQGEYDAQQAYEAFDSQLRQNRATKTEILLSPEQGYSSAFRPAGGSQAASVMANTLRRICGTEVLIAPAYSFTGDILMADYTEKRVGDMIMPNPLEFYQCEMTGAELKACLRCCVEGVEGGFTPFNPGSLPAVSGISIEVKDGDAGYILTNVRRDGEEISDRDSFRVTLLNTAYFMKPLLEQLTLPFEQGERRVELIWTDYIKNGGSLAAPGEYIRLK